MDISSQSAADISSLSKAGLGGFASRIDALARLSAQSKAIWYASLFIFLLFVVIETTPLFVKLIAGRSPYEYILHKHEHLIEMNHSELTSIRTNAVKNKISMENEVNSYAMQSISKAERQLLDQAIKNEVEKLNGGALDWKTWLAKGGFLKAE